MGECRCRGVRPQARYIMSRLRFNAPPVRSAAFGYGLAVVSVGAAFLLALALLHFTLPLPFTAVALSAIAIAFWYGGTKPGILAVLLSSLASGYFFGPEITTVFRLLYDFVFVIFALLMYRLTQTRTVPEVKVAEQTAELARSKSLGMMSSQTAAAPDLASLLAIVAEQLMRVLPNSGVAIFTRSSLDQAYWATARVGLSDEVLGQLHFAAQSPVIGMLDKAFDPRQAAFPESESEKLRCIGSALLVPVRYEGELVAFFSLGRKLSDEIYDQEDVGLLTQLGDEMARGVHQLRLRLEEQELNESREIQMGLLPKTISELAGYAIAAESHPARLVGGDYFDTLCVGKGKLALCIADVSGKGMPAALIMSNLQAAVRAFASDTLAPRDLCAKVNRIIWNNIGSDKFITFFYGLLDGSSSQFAYTNAGHNAPIVLRRHSRPLRLEIGGTVLGAFPDVPYQQGTLVIESGDLMVAFTDGISECMNSGDEEWGEDRLIDTLQDCDGLGPSEIIARVMEAAEAFAAGAPQFDDMTLLALRRQLVPTARLERDDAIGVVELKLR